MKFILFRTFVPKKKRKEEELFFILTLIFK